jgi:hypothetical protein
MNARERVMISELKAILDSLGTVHRHPDEQKKLLDEWRHRYLSNQSAGVLGVIDVLIAEYIRYVEDEWYA